MKFIETYFHSDIGSGRGQFRVYNFITIASISCVQASSGDARSAPCRIYLVGGDEYVPCDSHSAVELLNAIDAYVVDSTHGGTGTPLESANPPRDCPQ